MAKILGSVAVGEIVKLKESGTSQNYIVVHQGKPGSMYDDSCDGTWLLREEGINISQPWSSSEISKYEASSINAWLNGTMLDQYESTIKPYIKQVKIPFLRNGTIGASVESGANGLSCKVFLLSGSELGVTAANYNGLTEEGNKLDYFESGIGESALIKRICRLNGNPVEWWTRSPSMSQMLYAFLVYKVGTMNTQLVSNAYCIRPALILNSSLIVTDDGTITTNTSPTSPSNITVPSTAFEGDRIAVSWSASSDKESNLAGYTLQRLLSNGSWTQIYKGPSRAFTDSRISVGTISVQYRVQAYDSFNLTSNWTTSTTVKIIKKPPVLTTPFIVMTGQPILLSWTAIEGADSYTQWPSKTGGLAGLSSQ